MKKIIIFFGLVLAAYASQAQVVLNNIGNCVTSGNPNIIAAIANDIDPLRECNTVKDTSSGNFYVFDRSQANGSKWVAVASHAAVTLDGTTSPALILSTGQILKLDFSALNAADVNNLQDLLLIDELVTLSGVAEGSINLGTFTGVTIDDNLTIKQAFQDLETTLEAIPTKRQDVVADITARDAITGMQDGDIAYVQDATGDVTVASGAAMYIYDSGWQKVSELGSIDIVTDLAIANKTATTLDVTSSTGTDATIPAATATEAGLLTAPDKVIIDAIQTTTAAEGANLIGYEDGGGQTTQTTVDGALDELYTNKLNISDTASMLTNYVTAGEVVSNTLNSGQIIVGNASNVATAVTASGDATISNTGVIDVRTASETQDGLVEFASTAEITLGELNGTEKAISVRDISQDGTMAGNSTTVIPSENAVRTYVNNSITVTGVSNGLTLASKIVKLGGTLTEPTIITDGGFGLIFNGTNSTAFLQDDFVVDVADNANIYSNDLNLKGDVTFTLSTPNVVGTTATVGQYLRLNNATTGAAEYASIAASEVTNTAAGNISSTTVQAAINELDTEKQADVITTRGDVVIGNTTGDAVRLGVGTAGQVLTSDGTDVSWATPSTGFADPLTTVGDIIYRDGTNATTRLAVGADNTVLKVNGVNINYELQDAADVTNTAAGNIAATTVQAAINELDTEKLGGFVADAADGVDLSVVGTNLDAVLDINELPAITLAGADELAISDASNSNAISKVTVQDIIDAPLPLYKSNALAIAGGLVVGQKYRCDLGSTECTAGSVQVVY